MRLWIVFAVARLLRVPIDIHGSFFAKRPGAPLATSPTRRTPSTA